MATDRLREYVQTIVDQLFEERADLQREAEGTAREVARLRALLDRDRLITLLRDEGLGDGGELCSWRCSDKGRYPGPCGCVEALVNLITETDDVVSDPCERLEPVATQDSEDHRP